MNLQDLVTRVRIYTRDSTGSIFKETDIDIFLREAFSRFGVIPEFANMQYPIDKLAQITFIPDSYQYLLAIYASSRCLFQDEQDYRAGTLMNEVENKIDELKSLIESGQKVIKNAKGVPVTIENFNDAVVDTYFVKSYDDSDIFNTEPIM